MKRVPKPPERPVRLHQWLGVCPGLFRPLAKSRESRPVLDITHCLAVSELGQSEITLRFEAREALGAGEQTSLLGVLAVAQECLRTTSAFSWLTETEVDLPGRDLWESLRAVSADGSDELLRFRTTWRSISAACGGSGSGADIKLRQEHLRRLANVSVWEYVDGQRAPRRQSRLLSWVYGDDERLHLALNHRLAQALVGKPYGQVLMLERLKLRTETARVLHAALSSLVRPGFGFSVGEHKLGARLWPDWHSSAAGPTQRRRLHALRESLQQIGRLPNWTICQRDDGVVAIKRGHSESRDRETSHSRPIAAKPAIQREQNSEEKGVLTEGAHVENLGRLFLKEA